jgi:hypothetical protein
VPNNKIVLDLESDISETEREGGEDKCLSHFITHHERRDWVSVNDCRPSEGAREGQNGDGLKAI